MKTKLSTKKFTMQTAAIVMIAMLVLAALPVTAVFAAASKSNSAGSDHTVNSLPPATIVYDAIPSPLPGNMPSVGYQATQTSEFGDYIHLAGTNRLLNSVTVTMSDWALYADYTLDIRYSGNSTSWTHPITLNIYSNHLGVNGAPDTLLATMTQTSTIPWRPVADPTCSTPTAWRAGDGTCYNGFAFNLTFDMSSLNVVLPNDIIVGVVYNTQSYGAAPIGSNGPYNSLNVGALGDIPAIVGTDDNTDNVFYNSITPSNYTDGGAAGVGIFRQDTSWGVYGTVPFQITTTAVGGGTPNGDTTGVFRPSNGLLYLKNANTSGFADVSVNYGLGGDYPVVGDWDGDGTSTIGVYRNGSFFLRNSNSLGFADMQFAFGSSGDQPIAGDWDNNGTDTIGVFRPSNGQFLLRNDNSAGVADASFFLGNVGDVAIAGDWDGDQFDTVGVFRPSNGVLFMKNTNTSGFAEIAINYGIPGDQPVTGDWDADGIDTIGVYRNGQFLLRNSNTLGFADIVFDLGIPGDMPIAGDWDGLP